MRSRDRLGNDAPPKRGAHRRGLASGAARQLATLCVGLLAAVAAATAEPEGGASDVVIQEFMFMPMTLTVKTGSTVTWINRDLEPHTVVSDTGLFRSGALDADERFAFRFEQRGTYHFTCSVHPRMVGTIVVE